MNFPYLVLYNKNSVQRRAVADFPQHHFDLALLAKSPGIHPSGFKPKFNDKAPTLEIDATPRYASAVNVASCGAKLTKPNSRSPICPSEKNPDLLMYVMDLFSPSGGYVIDPFSGSMSTLLASLESNRQCVCLESDPTCYRFSLARARIFATPGKSMKDLAIFSDPEPCDDSMGPLNAPTHGTEHPSTLARKRDIRHAANTDSNSQPTISSTTFKISTTRQNSETLDTSTHQDNKRLRRSLTSTPIMPQTQNCVSSNPVNKTLTPDTHLSDITNPPICDATSHLKPGASVHILIDGVVVGEAVLQHPQQDGDHKIVARRIHGHHLRELETEDVNNDLFLAVIWKVKFISGFENTPYPYSFPGPDGCPGKLDEMTPSTFYVWDCNSLSLKG